MTVTLRAPVTPPTTANGLIRQVNSSRTTPKGGFRDINGNKQIVHVASAWSGSAGNAYLVTSLNGTSFTNVTAFAMSGDGEYVQSAFQDSLGKVHIVTYSFADGPRYRRIALSYTAGNISSCTVEANFTFSVDDGMYTADNRPDMCELRDGLGNTYIGFLNSCSRQSDSGWRINLARFARDVTAASQITGINGTGTRTELYTDAAVAGHERMACIVQFQDRTIGVFGGYVIGEFPQTTDYFAKALLPVATDTTWTLNSFANETTNYANHGNVVVIGNTAYRARMTSSDSLLRVDSITSSGTLTLNVFPTVAGDAGSAVIALSMSADATKVYYSAISYGDVGVLAYYDGSSWTRNSWSAVNWGGNAAVGPRFVTMLAVDDNATVHILTAWDDTVDVTNISASITGSGGTVSGGSASVTRATAVSSTGGIVSGGAALVLVAAVMIGSGGSVSGGAGTVASSKLQTYAITGTGGSVSGGVTAIIAHTAPVTSGGSVSGGSGSITVGAATIPLGGSISGGAASVTSSAATIGAGGSVSGGSGDVVFIPVGTYSTVGSGGSVSGGTTVVTVGVTVSGYGGSVSGGSATISSTVAGSYSIVGSGGSVSGGTASTRASLSFIGAGGSVSGGLSPVTVSTSHTATGGSVSGGTTSVVVGAATVGSGGAISGGSADVTIASFAFGNGGSVSGGTGFEPLGGPQNIVDGVRRVSTFVATIGVRRVSNWLAVIGVREL